MRVSIIIPAINEAPRMAEAVDRARMAGGDEIIVVDGGSRDETQRLAQQAGAIVLQSALGRAAQQNHGARCASGDALLFLHADTSLPVGSVQQIRAALMQAHVQCGAFVQRIDDDSRIYRWLEWGNGLRVRWRGIAYGDQGLWMRRAFFEQQGGFPVEPLLEDLLFMTAARRASWPLLLPGPLLVSARRWQAQGVARQTLRNWSILAAHACGASPARLAQRYRRHDA